MYAIPDSTVQYGTVYDHSIKTSPNLQQVTKIPLLCTMVFRLEYSDCSILSSLNGFFLYYPGTQHTNLDLGLNGSWAIHDIRHQFIVR